MSPYDRSLHECNPVFRVQVVCVTWEREMAAWTRAGCSLLSSTETASTCSCDSMGAFALLLAPAESSGAGSGGPGSAVPIVTLQIVTYCVAAVSVLCVVLILVKVSTSSL